MHSKIVLNLFVLILLAVGLWVQTLIGSSILIHEFAVNLLISIGFYVLAGYFVARNGIRASSRKMALLSSMFLVAFVVSSILIGNKIRNIYHERDLESDAYLAEGVIIGAVDFRPPSLGGMLSGQVPCVSYDWYHEKIRYVGAVCALEWGRLPAPGEKVKVIYSGKRPDIFKVAEFNGDYFTF